MTKTKALKITQVTIDKELYPRENFDYVTIARYANAMNSGAIFPPITVAKLDKKYILIDGAHRIEALKKNKEEYVQAEILTDLTKEEIFKKSIEANIAHGKQFTTHEVVKVIITLQNFNMSLEKISELVRLPVNEITPFIAKRSTHVTDNNGVRTLIALKAPLQNLAGLELTEDSKLEIQDRISGRSQLVLLDNLIIIMKNGWLNIESDLVKSKAKKVYQLLSQYFTTPVEK